MFSEPECSWFLNTQCPEIRSFKEMLLAERAESQADSATERVDVKTIYNTLPKLKAV